MNPWHELSSSWQLHRVGLVDFWYYDQQEFSLEEGRLLLRGGNGSGKSVTMQSFIPLLLDGDRRPERLDPFGSKDRKMSNYLLEEEDAREERTAYLYMEYKREESETYIGLGMGLRARKNKPTEAWYFLLQDGRRIGRDFLLYKAVGSKICLTKAELKNRLGEGGQFFERQREYVAAVNQQLFGFDTLEEYEELISLLIQLRTPKLSRDYRPTVLSEILSNSLQTLTENDLQPISESIENMENHKSSLDALFEAKKAADRIFTTYDHYNYTMLHQKALQFLKSVEEYQQIFSQRARLVQEAADLERQDGEVKHTLERLRQEQILRNQEKQDLASGDVLKMKEDLEQTKVKEEQARDAAEKKQHQIQEKELRLRALHQEQRRREEEKTTLKEAITQLLEEMEEYIQQVGFDEHDFLRSELKANFEKPYSFEATRELAKRLERSLRDMVIRLGREAEERRHLDEQVRYTDTQQRIRDQRERDVQKLEDQLEEIKGEFLEKIHQWGRDNRALAPEKETWVLFDTWIQRYQSKEDYENIKDAIRQVRYEKEAVLHQRSYELEGKIRDLREKRREKKAEIKEWEEKKEPSLPCSQSAEKNRAWLTQEQIPFCPLYKAIDFVENIPEDQINGLEEALLSMGILDALIVPEEAREKVLGRRFDMADKYLFAPQGQGLKLQDALLRLAEEAPEGSDSMPSQIREQTQKILSILQTVDPGGSYVSPQGYGLGVLQGQVSGAYKAGYIGEQRRKKLKEETLDRLEGELQALQNALQKEEEILKSVQDELTSLEEAFLALPRGVDLETAWTQLEKGEHQAALAKEAVRQAQEALKAQEQKYAQAQKQVWLLGEQLKIKGNLHFFEKAEEQMALYREELENLRSKHQDYLRSAFSFLDVCRQTEETLEDVQELRDDLSDWEKETRQTGEKVKSLEQMLALSNYEAVKQQLDVCIARLMALPGEMEEWVRKEESLRSQKLRWQEKHQELENGEEKAKASYQSTKQTYLEEESLGYAPAASVIFQEREGKQENDKKLSPEEKLNVERRWIHKGLELLEESGKLRDGFVIAQDLENRFQENYMRLQNYHLEMRTLFATPHSRIQEEVLPCKRRRDIVGKVNGVTAAFGEIRREIEDQIQLRSKILQEEDARLFREILADTLTRKIRGKLGSSEKWVEVINRHMASAETSNGFEISLSWNAKRAEEEDQLDAGELVRLLRKDVKLLTEADRERISQHFRSKIRKAQDTLQEKGNTMTFHSIIREVLDYRKWFEFQLYYKKAGEKKKEMTNSRFYTLSGGEKAMAMYVPLFSAVAAKYQGARSDAPKLISLDEAFAGVDEVNIRDMFRFMVEFKFNFIINSQVLWGDYDTVPSLAVYEILRPSNAKFIAVMPYIWNGKQCIRQKITLEERQLSLFED